jgi:sigma-E factor negative regulatory protein RseB
MRAWLLAAALAVAPVAAPAAEPPEDAMAWLQRIATAARSLNYSGTFVYDRGGREETSRILHYVDASGNEVEKLESLDGPPREVIRNNDEVKCYLSDNRTVKIERRRPGKAFPALLPEQLSSVAENYAVRLGGQERVAGLDCQVLVLEPRDGLRYGHRLWADTATGLLVKAVMVDDRGQPVEQFKFTQLSIGAAIDREMLKPRAAAEGGEWREERPSPSVAGDSGWSIRNQPRGFKKIMETQRALPGKSAPVTHIVISDGLVAVSVFIEPLPRGDKVQPGLSSQGAINVFTRPLADHLVTVLGEAPPLTVVRIANSVSPRAGKP